MPQAALTYLNASNTEVQVRGCEPSLEAAAVPLLRRSVEGCTIRHDFAANRSFRQSRYTYELDGAIWQAGPCSDDGTEYAHRQVYETTGGALVCEPIVSRDLGTVTHQSRVQIDLDTGSQFITECKPDSSANALVATVEGCTNPASWTHDVSAGVSYGQERFYYERSGTRTFVSECVNSETVYNHQQTISGWQNHDGQLYAYRLTTLSIDTPQGPYTVLSSEVLPGAEEEPYVYEGLTTKLDGTGWYEGCTEYAGQDSVKLYRRPDGTSYEVVVGDAAPVNKGNKCTVSAESRTVYAYTEWKGGQDGYYLGAGCANHPNNCPWRSYWVHLPSSRQVTGLSSYNDCITLGGGISMTHYDRRQSRQVTQFPDGTRQYGSWVNEGAPYVRAVNACPSVGSEPVMLHPNPLFRQILAPLSVHYDDPATVEIRMSRPGEVVTERRGEGKRVVEDKGLSLAVIESISRSLGNANGLAFDADESPKLSCILPESHRFECLVGPSVRTGLSLAIRCKHPFTPAWEQAGGEPRRPGISDRDDPGRGQHDHCRGNQYRQDDAAQYAA